MDEVVTLKNTRRQVVTPAEALDRSRGKIQIHVSLNHITVGPNGTAGIGEDNRLHQGKTHHWWNYPPFVGAQSVFIG